jgi:glutaredoxin
MLILYGTSACHLCEIAAALLDAADVRYREVDISDSDVLFERYGITIPVLRHEDGRELNWPFDENALADFLNRA